MKPIRVKSVAPFVIIPWIVIFVALFGCGFIGALVGLATGIGVMEGMSLVTAVVFFPLCILGMAYIGFCLLFIEVQSEP